MANFPISVNSVKESSKGIKQKAMEKVYEAKRILLSGNLGNFSNIPLAMETLKESASGIIGSMEQTVDSQIKKETDMSINEMRAKCSEGFQKFSEYKQLCREKKTELIDKSKKLSKKEKEEMKQRLTEKRNKKKEEFENWMADQNEAVYNAFFAIQLKDSLDSLKGGLAQMWNGQGSLKDSIYNLKILKEMFD